MITQAASGRPIVHALGIALLLAGVLPAVLALPGNPGPASHPSLMASPAAAPAPPQAQISVAISPSSYGLDCNRRE
jgi:hypothetical protein